MAIIKQYHKDTDTTYVYESTYYYDENSKQSRSKRKVIGKIDKETGEIIPTGKRGRKKKSPIADDMSSIPSKESGSVEEENRLREVIAEQERKYDLLKTWLDILEEKCCKLQSERDAAVKELKEQSRRFQDSINRTKRWIEKAIGSLDES